MKNKWYQFKVCTPANRQKLPPEKKYVLVMLRTEDWGCPDPICVGYLKFHAGERSEPWFVTPGAGLENVISSDDRVVAWNDCLPDNWEWPRCSSQTQEEYKPFGKRKL